MTEYNKWLHWFALFTAVCTFFLIIAGGLVTSTGSGLAVPDWPLSYGKFMPPMVGGIFYEHGHRMIASTVGFLTIILCIWLWKKEERRCVRILGVVAVGAVILQGALGGLTVLFMLPTAISALHATVAQTFFCIVSSIAFFTSKQWIHSDDKKLNENNKLPSLTLCISIGALIYLQLILGTVMRHTDSGLAVPDFPLAYGRVLPSLSGESLEQYNKLLILDDVRLAADGPISVGQIVIHMLHRYCALAVAVGGIILSISLWKSQSAALKRFSSLLIILIVFQISLGAWTVLSRKAVEVATAHVAVGALLLVCTVLSTLCVIRLSQSYFVRIQSVS